MFVIISTHRAVTPVHDPWSHLGSVWGPFSSWGDAEEARASMNFPNPGDVVIKTLHRPH